MAKALFNEMALGLICVKARPSANTSLVAEQDPPGGLGTRFSGVY